MIKNSSVNNFFNSMTCENDNFNTNSNSQSKGNTLKYKINSNDYKDVKINKIEEISNNEKENENLNKAVK